ncbi:GGDEF domain-containing protein [Mycobacterium alsense]|uniref:GGDEF domain-containing protein n=2 Tax=Mycobacterium alsense TaxID=324058 RepID=A0AA42BXB2_9MYCO|nr:GGDEF domain-containing protein [Mycobacterium alsense]OQZ93497.1 GGDEF domain-containing protein [Mycobacterium alsense]
MTRPDQYEGVSAYLKGRGLQTIWRRATFAFTASQAALPLLMLRTPTGPADPTLRAAFVGIAALGFAGAFWWLLRWPTRRQSIGFSLGATAAIAVTCLGLANPYAGLMGCTTFAILGGFTAYFHTGHYVFANFVVAAACAATLAHRLTAATGDIALTSAGLITVTALNIGVPFGIRSLVHTLRTDLLASDRDALTGLHNRRSFYDAVHELITLRRRSPGRYLVIAVIDLDDFKKINDTQGHAVGDQVLVAVGEALRQSCAGSAVIGRIGGEEFVIVDTDTTPNPVRMAERLRRAIADVPFPITASIGTSGVALDIAPPTDDTQLIDDLISTSDAAMYEAKRAGGNQVRHRPALLSPGAR